MIAQGNFAEDTAQTAISTKHSLAGSGLLLQAMTAWPIRSCSLACRHRIRYGSLCCTTLHELLKFFLMVNGSLCAGLKGCGLPESTSFLLYHRKSKHTHTTLSNKQQAIFTISTFILFYTQTTRRNLLQLSEPCVSASTYA